MGIKGAKKEHPSGVRAINPGGRLSGSPLASSFDRALSKCLTCPGLEGLSDGLSPAIDRGGCDACEVLAWAVFLKGSFCHGLCVRCCGCGVYSLVTVWGAWLKTQGSLYL